MQIVHTVEKLVQQKYQPEYNNFNAEFFSSQLIALLLSNLVMYKSPDEKRKYHLPREGIAEKNKSWAYVFTNNDLLRMAGAEDIHTFVCKQQVKYVSKVIRKENESIQKQLLFNDNESTKPKTNLMSSILNSSGQNIESLCGIAKQ